MRIENSRLRTCLTRPSLRLVISAPGPDSAPSSPGLSWAPGNDNDGEDNDDCDPREGGCLYNAPFYKLDSVDSLPEGLYLWTVENFPDYLHPPRNYSSPNLTSWRVFKNRIDERRAAGEEDIQVIIIYVMMVMIKMIFRFPSSRRRQTLRSRRLILMS